MPELKLENCDVMVQFEPDASLPEKSGLLPQSGALNLIWPSSIPLKLELASGSVYLKGMAEQVDLRLQDSEILLGSFRGSLRLLGQKLALESDDFRGKMDLEIQDCEVSLTRFSGQFALKAQDCTLGLKSFQEEARLELRLKDSTVNLSPEDADFYLVHADNGFSHQGAIASVLILAEGEDYSLGFSASSPEEQQEPEIPETVDLMGENILEESEELMDLWDKFESRMDADLEELQSKPAASQDHQNDEKPALSRRERFYQKLYREKKISLEELEKRLKL